MHKQLIHSVRDVEKLLTGLAPRADRHLGDILVEEGVINQDQLNKALALQKSQVEKHGLPGGHRPRSMQLGEILTQMGLANQEQITLALASKFNIPFVKLEDFEVPAETLSLIPADLALQYHVLPLAVIQGKLVVAMTNPMDWEALEAIRFTTNRSLELVVASNEDISRILGDSYSSFDENEALESLEFAPIQDSAVVTEEDVDEMAMQRPIARLLNAILLQALSQQASDINIRPEKDSVSIYLRVDGKLQFIRTLHKSLLAPLVSRIKIISRMNIAERRMPQDGHARLIREGRAIDLRISVIPTVTGESVVIRVLEKSIGLRTLDKLGFRPHETDQLRELTTRPYGMVLVTGPTGSGKSTTLYAVLNEVKKSNPHIITVEDPVEYAMDGVEQIQVSSAPGYTFAEALRHILRHDPDVIMLGEMRDLESVRIAIKASLTGHMVYSTLHTNDAVSAVTRLADMGVEPYLLSSTLLGVLAQRLVRLNCPHCKAVEKVEPYMRKTLKVSEDEVFYRGSGCENCNHTGYHGRVSVGELLNITPAIRHLIHLGKGEEVIREAALREGMIPLVENALSLAREGSTSLEEVFGVRL